MNKNQKKQSKARNDIHFLKYFIQYFKYQAENLKNKIFTKITHINI